MTFYREFLGSTLKIIGDWPDMIFWSKLVLKFRLFLKLRFNIEYDANSTRKKFVIFSHRWKRPESIIANFQQKREVFYYCCYCFEKLFSFD